LRSICPAGAEHDRQLSRIDVEAFDQRLRLIIGLWIEQLNRVTVTTEKALKPEHISAVGAADDDRTAGASFKQPDAAEDQSTHDPLAKFGFCNQKRTQPLGCNDQGFDRILRNSVRQRRPARQLGQFTQELARAVRDNETFA
jgi:hypothetical protein